MAIRISELIKVLENRLSEHGDLPVFFQSGYDNYRCDLEEKDLHITNKAEYTNETGESRLEIR